MINSSQSFKKIAHQKPTRGNLNPHTNPWSQHYPEQIYQQNGPQRSLRTLTLSSINIIILLLIIVIIIINGSSRRSIIIISTIFIIITSTSSPLSFLSSKSLQNHFHHHRRRRLRYYNCLEQKHVEKEVEYMPYSVGYHCYFISQSTKALQLKKRARFWYAKNYFIVKTIYWLQWLRHSICILINELHLQLFEVSKIANKDSQ